MENVTLFLLSIFGERLATVIGAMIPLIELKGSIVFARGVGLSFFEAFLYSFLGSTSVFFIAYFLFVPILNLLKKIKFFNLFALAVEDYFTDKSKTTGNVGNGLLNKIITVFIFVALPLPLTGVWTGSVIALLLGLKFKYAFPSVALGNLVAGLIISVLAELFLPYLNIILSALFIIALVLFIVLVVKIILRMQKIRANSSN
ncbi:MAG: small multi-drug export protein [Clostridia bacterium]|nr:small multi-drug export protein [Clostridia bacterium]